jgi:selenocysteine lyase/cysteine desulfurase
MGEKLIDKIRNETIGEGHSIEGPWGPHRLQYVDWAASGRAVKSIEEYIQMYLTMYANTHSEASGTATQTTRLRNQAREIIERELGVPDDASVLFCGSGSTAAIDRMIRMLELYYPKHLLEKERSDPTRPVVFIGPYEHHSNMVPWRETIAEVVTIAEDARGGVDLNDLERQLLTYKNRNPPPRQLIGSFGAASNVTGITTNVQAVTAVLKKHGAYAMFDHAADGAHAKITLGDADALFFSPHKFVGGVGTPGILVVRNNLLPKVPVVAGGGTVSFVSDKCQEYLPHHSEREEGGTPDIIGSIRAGMIFKLKADIGYDYIAEREEYFVREAISKWSRNKHIKLLGNITAPRVSIVSFVVRSPFDVDPLSAWPERWLHYHFIVTLLNDLFGIQTRGGCACAGPYGHDLLRIPDKQSQQLREASVDGLFGIKLGWARVTFSYLLSDKEFDYIVKAVDMVATHGWKLLPHYTFNEVSGIWTHRSAPPPRMFSLDDISYDTKPSLPAKLDESVLDDYFVSAQQLFDSQDAILSDNESQMPQLSPNPIGMYRDRISDLFEDLRWFELPPECVPPKGDLPSPSHSDDTFISESDALSTSSTVTSPQSLSSLPITPSPSNQLPSIPELLIQPGASKRTSFINFGKGNMFDTNRNGSLNGKKPRPRPMSLSFLKSPDASRTPLYRIPSPASAITPVTPLESSSNTTITTTKAQRRVSIRRIIAKVLP